MLRRVALVGADVSEEYSASETPALTRTTRRNIPEDAILYFEPGYAVDIKCLPSIGRSKPPATNKQKLRGPSSASELYRLIDRHLSTKFSVNFCG
jgi:hypothetical protein